MTGSYLSQQIRLCLSAFRPKPRPFKPARRRARKSALADLRGSRPVPRGWRGRPDSYQRWSRSGSARTLKSCAQSCALNRRLCRPSELASRHPLGGARIASQTQFKPPWRLNGQVAGQVGLRPCVAQSARKLAPLALRDFALCMAAHRRPPTWLNHLTKTLAFYAPVGWIVLRQRRLRSPPPGPFMGQAAGVLGNLIYPTFY